VEQEVHKIDTWAALEQRWNNSLDAEMELMSTAGGMREVFKFGQ
jgi:hypothetical protein